MICGLGPARGILPEKARYLPIAALGLNRCNQYAGVYTSHGYQRGLATCQTVCLRFGGSIRSTRH